MNCAWHGSLRWTSTTSCMDRSGPRFDVVNQQQTIRRTPLVTRADAELLALIEHKGNVVLALHPPSTSSMMRA